MSFFFHLKKGRLYSENTAEPELGPKFPGSKTCEINSPKVLSLRLKKKTIFSVFFYALNPTCIFRLQSCLLVARQYIGNEGVQKDT